MSAKEVEEERDHEQLKIEINHILDSGANDIRLIELFEKYYYRGVYWRDKCISINDQLTKQEVAFRETVKIQHEEILHLRNAIATMCKTITTT